VVGLSSTAVHDVPDWRGRELRRGIVYIPHVSFIAVSPVESTSVVVGEIDGAAAAVSMIEVAYAADIDLEGVTSETEV
jgi:hypothetical protein